MKLISINIWGGRLKEPFLDFLKKHKDTDIFCFQEVYKEAKGKEPETFVGNPCLDIYGEIREILNTHEGFFRPSAHDFYGQALFLNKKIKTLEEGDIITFQNPDPNPPRGGHSRNMQWVRFAENSRIFTIMNLHGVWAGEGVGKNDTSERLEQSDRIAEFMKGVKGPQILCGDFNLLPHTKSLEMLEDGMRNLIKEYGIQSTRTSYYNKPEKFADYILVSKDIKVKDFKVLPDEVSDHAALYLEFE